MALSISAGPTLVHRAIFLSPDFDALSSSACVERLRFSHLASGAAAVNPQKMDSRTARLAVRGSKVLWEKELDRGFWSSPIAAADRVYLIDRSGAMQVFKLDDEFELLAESKMREGAYATPAFVGDRIYIRGLTHLFCISATAE